MGAVTLASGSKGLSGVVSATNSVIDCSWFRSSGDVVYAVDKNGLLWISLNGAPNSWKLIQQ